MLALGSAGVLTAWAHNRSSLLDFLVARDIAGLSAAARHLIGARERATADLSGLLEGFGIISAALLFAGPLEVRPLPGILDGHTVAGVRDPVALPRMLAHEEPFDQAIVDLRYVQSAATELTALAQPPPAAGGPS